MKKIIGLTLLLALTLSLCAMLFSCKKEDYTLNVAYLNGPTGMGMAKLIEDSKAKGEEADYTFIPTTAELVGAGLISGEFDIACMPTNTAASLYNKGAEIEILAINCLNSIYVITDETVTLTSISDLENKTIYTCKGGTPAPILNALLTAYGVNATVSTEFNGSVIAKPENLVPVITDKNNSPAIVVAPEPIITSALLAINKDSSNTSEYSIDIDLGKAWKDHYGTDITMGCIAARKQVITENKAAVDRFLNEYKASIEFIGNSENIDASADLIFKSGIMAAAPAAKKALSNLNKGGYIAYLDGTEMKNALIKLYEVFGNALIGGKMPDDGLYYVD